MQPTDYRKTVPSSGEKEIVALKETGVNKDNIIEIARMAGLPIERDDEGEYIGCLSSFDRYELVRRIAAVEREECAKLCDWFSDRYPEATSVDCSDIIRSRGKE